MNASPHTKAIGTINELSANPLSYGAERQEDDMNHTLTPKVLKIERQTGIAGQYAYVASVDYGPEHGGVHEVQFVGNDVSEHVHMVTTDFQVLVRRSDLDGVRLSPDYVRRFFS